MSPDGLYGAYAVNQAVATRSADAEISGCKSTSKLFVTRLGREKAEAVLVMEPSEDASGNSIELIDWSPEGTDFWYRRDFGRGPRMPAESRREFTMQTAEAIEGGRVF